VEPRFVWKVANPCGTSLRVIKCMRGGSTRTGKLYMLVNAKIKTKMYVDIMCQDDT